MPFGAAHTYIAHIREYPPPRAKGAIIFVTSVGAVQEGEMFCQLLQNLTLKLQNFLPALNQFFGCHDAKWAKR